MYSFKGSSLLINQLNNLVARLFLDVVDKARSTHGCTINKPLECACLFWFLSLCEADQKGSPCSHRMLSPRRGGSYQWEIICSWKWCKQAAWGMKIKNKNTSVEHTSTIRRDTITLLPGPFHPWWLVCLRELTETPRAERRPQSNSSAVQPSFLFFFFN